MHWRAPGPLLRFLSIGAERRRASVSAVRIALSARGAPSNAAPFEENSIVIRHIASWAEENGGRATAVRGTQAVSHIRRSGRRAGCAVAGKRACGSGRPQALPDGVFAAMPCLLHLLLLRHYLRPRSIRGSSSFSSMPLTPGAGGRMPQPDQSALPSPVARSTALVLGGGSAGRRGFLCRRLYRLPILRRLRENVLA